MNEDLISFESDMSMENEHALTDTDSDDESVAIEFAKSSDSIDSMQRAHNFYSSQSICWLVAAIGDYNFQQKLIRAVERFLAIFTKLNLKGRRAYYAYRHAYFERKRCRNEGKTLRDRLTSWVNDDELYICWEICCAYRYVAKKKSHPDILIYDSAEKRFKFKPNVDYCWVDVDINVTGNAWPSWNTCTHFMQFATLWLQCRDFDEFWIDPLMRIFVWISTQKCIVIHGRSTSFLYYNRLGIRSELTPWQIIKSERLRSFVSMVIWNLKLNNAVDVLVSMLSGSKKFHTIVLASRIWPKGYGIAHFSPKTPKAPIMIMSTVPRYNNTADLFVD